MKFNASCAVARASRSKVWLRQFRHILMRDGARTISGIEFSGKASCKHGSTLCSATTLEMLALRDIANGKGARRTEKGTPGIRTVVKFCFSCRASKLLD